MGFIENLQKALKPHADRASSEFAFHMAALHNKLAAIERASIDAARGDIGDHWQRFQIKRKFASGEEIDIGTCPMNEIWMIQSISSDGVQEKSPPFVFLASGVLLESILKEGVGFEGIGGNQIVMRGERFTVLAREAGNINCTVTIIRRLLPTPKAMTSYGKDTLSQPADRNTHEPDRDRIGARLATSWVEPAPALQAGEGEKA